MVDLVWGMSSSRAKHSEVAGDRSIILATQWERRVLQAGLVLGSRAAHAAVCSPRLLGARASLPRAESNVRRLNFQIYLA